jgi:hypothetical protein
MTKKAKKAQDYEKKIQSLMRARIRQSMDCDFKKAFVPKGWAVLKVDRFVKDVAKEIVREFLILKRTR